MPPDIAEPEMYHGHAIKPIGPGRWSIDPPVRDQEGGGYTSVGIARNAISRSHAGQRKMIANSPASVAATVPTRCPREHLASLQDDDARCPP